MIDTQSQSYPKNCALSCISKDVCEIWNILIKISTECAFKECYCQ